VRPGESSGRPRLAYHLHVASVDERRRVSFDAKAEQYDEARPGYPDALFRDVLARTGARRILEVGAGTGKATVPLARGGCEVLALEPGPRLAARLRVRTRDFPAVTVVESTFEAWAAAMAAQPAEHDLVLAAQSLHWVDPTVRYVASARAARHLAVVTNETAAIDAGVRADFDVAYDRWTGDDYGNERARHTVDVTRRTWTAEIDASGLFGPVHVLQFGWEAVYTSQSYIRLIDTYSENATLGEPQRAGLYADLAASIDRHGGRLVVPYVALGILATAKRDRHATAALPESATGEP
jgi:SAM-dependent methyltransferase